MCCACSNVKTSTTSFHSCHSSVSLVLCIRTVPSQFVHRQGLSFSNILHLSSPLRTGKPVGLITMRIKALELLMWLAKEDRLLNPRTLEYGLLRFWQGCLPPRFLPTFTKIRQLPYIPDPCTSIWITLFLSFGFLPTV